MTVFGIENSVHKSHAMAITKTDRATHQMEGICFFIEQIQDLSRKLTNQKWPTEFFAKTHGIRRGAKHTHDSQAK